MRFLCKRTLLGQHMEPAGDTPGAGLIPRKPGTPLPATWMECGAVGWDSPVDQWARCSQALSRVPRKLLSSDSLKLQKEGLTSESQVSGRRVGTPTNPPVFQKSKPPVLPSGVATASAAVHTLLHPNAAAPRFGASDLGGQEGHEGDVTPSFTPDPTHICRSLADAQAPQ